MDRSLDEVISERQRSNYRRTNGRSNAYPRDGIKKSSQPEYVRGIDKDWVHDRYDDDSLSRRPHPRTIDRYEPATENLSDTAGRLRVDNLHYDLNEVDLRGLFTRIGPVTTVQILYDRQDRSRGIAYVNYASVRDAQRAIREFDGANANGQPIKLTLQPTAPSAARNPFDSVKLPGRSLFDRIDDTDAPPPRERRRRSESPPRRSDVRRPPPEGIDRYVPGDRRLGRSRSPISRRPTPRRPGARREDSDRGRGGRGRDKEGRPVVQGRPRKTADELDAEMEDYWGKKDSGDAPAAQNGGAADGNAVAASEINLDDDIDMIE